MFDWYCEKIEKFRQLPTPLLMVLVLSRFVFGFGLGAALAAPRKSSWRAVGWATMGLAVLLALPAAKEVLED
jgi:hypothetical protein